MKGVGKSEEEKESPFVSVRQNKAEALAGVGGYGDGLVMIEWFASYVED